MTFMELLLSAKLGSTSAFEELFARQKSFTKIFRSKRYIRRGFVSRAVRIVCTLHRNF